MINELVKQELCTGCGICVSQDRSHKAFMNKDKYGFIVPNVTEVSEENQHEMLKVCPFSPLKNNLDEDSLAEEFLVDSVNFSEKIGRYNGVYVGYSNEFRETSSSGGIGTYVFHELLKSGIVESIFVVNDKNGKYEYGFIDSIEDINSVSKTRYTPVTMEELFLKINDIKGAVAVCGVGCFLKAIRLKQHLYPEFKKKIVFTIGIICGGLKSEFFSDYLSQKAGINGAYRNQNYRLKDKNSTARDYSYGALDMHDSTFKTVKMRSVGDMWGTGLFKSNACDFCDDVTTELADISLGDAWIEPYSNDGLGNNVIVTRSILADNLIKEGIKTNALSVEELNYKSFVSSQRGSFTHRQDALLYRLKRRSKKKLLIPQKRERVFKNISISAKLVQSYRARVRKKSLIVWKENNDVVYFDAKLRNGKNMLRVLTKINHYLRK
ncbi:Coenzyme F420 hydrogenase/dehydrogenase, beta subunit C-terminal domain [Myroides odoratimimus]|uniref:Coenzyme F420 hydrogenase/dehydrogenase, beta subunit C-terminal domain n=1 Tax=Myroides odoratimimus TaxID=76832 RepID=UPI0025787809|nr:Coenzyme F420 hydrogenase/dehydrogenase, beta subunit C-terminal domain [Myroides odoratimimus]MDM1450399.1 Coenzyme F420 hydrogenase/dehydrogenase, beta subunit C-terminal domain [Myroides odoratimimus]